VICEKIFVPPVTAVPKWSVLVRCFVLEKAREEAQIPEFLQLISVRLKPRVEALNGQSGAAGMACVLEACMFERELEYTVVEVENQYAGTMAMDFRHHDGQDVLVSTTDYVFRAPK